MYNRKKVARLTKTILKEVKIVREKDIEEYLRDKIKAIGGKAYKFISPGNVGVPDRFVALPGGISVYVELKAPGKKSTSLQQKRQKELRDFGFIVFSDIDSKAKVDTVVGYCKGLIKQ